MGKAAGTNHWRCREIDGTTLIESAYQPHEDRLYVETKSAIEPLIADERSRIRSAQMHQPTVRLHLMMSMEQYSDLIHARPELQARNPDDRRRAWEKLAKERPDLVARRFQNRYEGDVLGASG